MSNFALYELLLNQASDKDLTSTQKTSLVLSIQNLDEDTNCLIFAVIKTYYISNETSEKTIIPYHGIFVDKNEVKFDLAKFPKKLRQMLHNFMKMHQKKLEEDKKLSRPEISEKTSEET